MSWSPAFLSTLEQRTGALKLLFRTRTISNEPAVDYSIATHPGLGADEAILQVHGAAVDGAEMAPRGPWKGTIGLWNVFIVGSFQPLLQHIARGAIVELLAGFDQMPAADFERIAIGRFRDLKGKAGPAWRLDMLDIPASCRCRLDTGFTLNGLFAATGLITTLAANYTPGDATLQTSSAPTNFKRETGAAGGILVTPTTGDPFYLSYTGTATGPDRFTGVSAAAICGTTAVAAVAGDRVQEVVLLQGHPLDIVRKLLCSTGAGTNGAYDTYPLEWGLGFLDELVDHDDIDRWKADVVTIAGTYNWQIIATEEQEDGFAYFSSILGPAGMFISSRQGCITVRAAQSTQTAPYHSGITITDQDLDTSPGQDGGIEAYEAYEYTLEPEYCGVQVRGDQVLQTGPTTNAATLPQKNLLSYDLSSQIWGSTADDVAMCQEVIDRTEEQATRIPERLVLRCAGRRLAQLAPGDVVTLDITRCPSRRDGAAGFVNRNALVTSVGTQWAEGRTRIVCLVFPETDDRFA